MAGTAPLTVLVHEWVTGGGLAGFACPASWAAEGSAMRRAVAADFAAVNVNGSATRVIITVDERWPLDPGPWTAIPIAQSEFLGHLLELSSQADYTVVIAPETTGILANLTRSLEQAGVRTLGCSAASIDLTGNKARLAEWLEARRIPTPRSRTVVPTEGLPEDTGGPWVLKPIDGAGAIDTFFLTRPDALPDAARQMPLALLQPFLPGIPMSASFLVDDASVAWLIAVGQQNVAIRDGRLRYEGGILPVPCREAEPVLRQAVASISGLRGFVGVDFLWDAIEAKATVLEINPRPTTSYVALCRLLPPGCLAQSWLAAHGEPSCSRESLPALVEIVNKQRPIGFDIDGRISGNPQLPDVMNSFGWRFRAAGRRDGN
jgi:predicted ATP-grasp superfamily ATP-dependent carboligase